MEYANRAEFNRSKLLGRYWGAVWAGVLLCVGVAQVQAQNALAAVLPAPAALVLQNVPPVDAQLAVQVGKYTEFKPTKFASWHPTKLEMLVSRRYQNTPQIYRLSSPGAALELLTDYPEPVGDAGYEPRTGDYYVFRKDAGGNEVFRAYRRDVSGGDAVPITPEGQRLQAMSWSKSGKKIVYVTVPVNRQGSADQIHSSVFVANPLDPDAARKVAEFEGGGWQVFSFSPDEKRLVYQEYVSANESYLWLMDIKSGKSRRITGKQDGEPVVYDAPLFSRDGKGLYVLSDYGSEFQQLNYIDIASRKRTVLTPNIPWNIESIDLSDDGKTLAFVANEDGMNVLRLMRTADNQILTTPPLPNGTISGIEWHKDSTHLAFTLSSATSPAEVYVLDMKANAITRWTTHEPMQVDPHTFVEPELVRWQSFDGRTISGFLYRAPVEKFPGKRPVLINIHGGPESQYQPGFLGRNNYFLNELGISLLFPNVRGSSGYGKSFLKLDNGMLREDSVKDIGALLDWIGTQPSLDAKRIAVMGGSYGGYMSLAVSTEYAHRIAASIDVVGISNFVTFLEKTESYRRDLRRVEYGDERDPAMRAYMEGIAPLNNASRIIKPLFVVQGKNDPRVPYQEADQIVATVQKNGTPVWYMMANDEGHGFAKKANADYQFFTTIGFLKKYLLSTAP